MQAAPACAECPADTAHRVGHQRTLRRLMDITANNLRTWLDSAGEVCERIKRERRMDVPVF